MRTFTQIVDAILKRYLTEISAAPEYWGTTTEAEYSGIEDGAQYDGEQTRPAFITEDLRAGGWVEIPESGIELRSPFDRR